MGLHDHVPVDVKNSLAGVHLLFQQNRELLADLLQENVGCVGDEHLKHILEILSVALEHESTATASEDRGRKGLKTAADPVSDLL